MTNKNYTTCPCCGSTVPSHTKEGSLPGDLTVCFELVNFQRIEEAADRLDKLARDPLYGSGMTIGVATQINTLLRAIKERG